MCKERREENSYESNGDNCEKGEGTKTQKQLDSKLTPKIP